MSRTALLAAVASLSIFSAANAADMTQVPSHLDLFKAQERNMTAFVALLRAVAACGRP
jgi:hypothetical protein